MGGMKPQVVRLVGTPVGASIGGNTWKVYAAKWKAWTESMRRKGMGPWLHLLDEALVVSLLLEFMAFGLFVNKLVTNIPPLEVTFRL